MADTKISLLTPVTAAGQDPEKLWIPLFDEDGTPLNARMNASELFNTVPTADVTAFGLDLLESADDSVARQTIGLGSLSTGTGGRLTINCPSIAGNGEILTLTTSLGTASLRVGSGNLFVVGGDIAAIGNASRISGTAHLKFGTGSDAGILYAGAGALKVTDGGSGFGTISASGASITPAWSGTGTATTPLVVNVTADPGPAAAGSKLLDCQVSGSSKFFVKKSGVIALSGIEDSAGAYTVQMGSLGSQFGVYAYIGASGMLGGSNGLTLASNWSFGWTNASHNPALTQDASFVRAAPSIVGVTNGSTGPGKLAIDLVQGTNLERFKMEWASSVARIGTEKAGTGTARDFAIITDDTIRMVFYGSGGINTGGSAITTYMLQQTSSRLQIQAPETIATAGATGNAGEICWDASYLYICTATDTWRRIAHVSW